MATLVTFVVPSTRNGYLVATKQVVGIEHERESFVSGTRIYPSRLGCCKPFSFIGVSQIGNNVHQT